MEWILLLITLACVQAYEICTPTHIPKCRREDSKCLTNIANIVYKAFVTGNKELDIPTSDPMYLKDVNGDLETVKYVLTNSTKTGYKYCTFQNATLTPDEVTATLTMFCPRFTLRGTYAIDGYLGPQPIKGNGPFTIESSKYLITVVAKLRKYEGCDGNIYVTFKRFKVKADAKGVVKFDLLNLWGENKELGAKTLNYINENCHAVADCLQEPVFKATTKILLKHWDLVLKVIPFKEFIINPLPISCEND